MTRLLFAEFAASGQVGVTEGRGESWGPEELGEGERSAKTKAPEAFEVAGAPLTPGFGGIPL